jgi:hypothetical protein
MNFKFFEILTQNPKLIAFDFTKKTPVCQKKTDRNYIFLDSKAHIKDRIYIMVH